MNDETEPGLVNKNCKQRLSVRSSLTHESVTQVAKKKNRS